MNAGHIEIALAKHFNPRQNIIVPNVWWGFGLNYEADLIVVHKSGYATEIEIKTSKQDIKRDLKKRYFHNSNKIRRFFYAVPWHLADSEYLRSDCGLIVVNEKLHCKTIRAPRHNKQAQRLTETEIRKILHLGCMRIWSLKQKLNPIQRAKENP